MLRASEWNRAVMDTLKVFGGMMQAANSLGSSLLKLVASTPGVLGFYVQTEGLEVTVWILLEAGVPRPALPPLPKGAKLETEPVRPFYHPVAAKKAILGDAKEMGPVFTPVAGPQGGNVGVHQGLAPGATTWDEATVNGRDLVSGLGSVGAIAMSEGNLWLITANHVLSENGRFGQFPGPNDGVLVGGGRPVSRDLRFVPIRDSKDNLVDIAVARLTATPRAGAFYNPGLSDGLPWTTPPASRLQAQATPIKVFGRLGVKDGWLESNSYQGEVQQNFSPTRPGYANQLLLRGSTANFVVKGDSGSLVAGFDRSRGQWRPIGIVFAVTDTNGLAIASPLQFVLDAASRATGSRFTRILTRWPAV